MRLLDSFIKWIVLLGGAAALASSCLGEEMQESVEGGMSSETEIIEVTFHPSLDGSLASKAIGDAAGVDQLRVSVFQVDDAGQGECIEQKTLPWKDVQADGLNLKLSGDKEYRILFWAEDGNNTAYSIAEDGSINVDYSDYLNAGFSKMEELDAFFSTSLIIPGQSERNQRVVLTRPSAQLNFADKTQPQKGVHTAKVAFHSMPKSFNPFSGKVEVTDPADVSDDITFTFTDFPSEPLVSNGQDYHYVSTNYVFAPLTGSGSVSLTVELLKADEVLSRHEFKDDKVISTEPRKKVNMIDYMVPEPEKWSEWNGLFPSVSTLSQDPDDPDSYLIDDAEDIAFLGDKDAAGALGEGKTFRLMVNVDMGHKPYQRSLRLPDGSTFDGNGYTIKGIKMMVGLFGDKVSDLTLRNLTVDGAEISSTTNGYKGVLANSLCGSSSLTNVVVANSSVITGEGAAGGLVGCVSRVNKNDRSEQIEVVIDDCHVVNTYVESPGYEGYLVGALRGYDNGEKLILKENCSVMTAQGAEPLGSYIVEGNEAVWMAGNNYGRFNEWVGGEECYRGQLYFGDMRFIAKWDGLTAVEPLLADPVYDDSAEHKVIAGKNRYVIYSPFDLAGARKKTSAPKALYLKTDVDMNGQGQDGVYGVPDEFEQSKCKSEDDNWFKPFSYVKDLDGQNNTIYNLSLHSKARSDTAYTCAFILSVQKDTVTTHKNLNMRNCCTVVPVFHRGEGYSASQQQDLSHGAIFMCASGGDTSSGTPVYTMNNIHIYDSKVFALQHSGVLCGILARANMLNCSVNNCHIENYNCEVTPELFSKKVTIAGNEIEVSEYFYSHGEIGALVGSVRRECTISNCHVRNTRIHAFHEPDKEAKMRSDGLLGKAAIATAKALGYYLIPGRHVSTLIGSIRTINGETITINGCTVDAATRCTQSHNKHNDSYPFIGQAYFVQFQDTEGKVIIDGNELTLADCNKNTER